MSDPTPVPTLAVTTSTPPAVSPPVENTPPAAAAAPTAEPPAGWRDRLTDADYPVLLTVLREHHARRRPLHAEALSIRDRLTEGTTR